MAKEVLELEVKANVSGASSEFKELNNTVKESITEVEELNEQLEIQTEVVNNLETALLKMKQQQSVNSDYENSVSGLNDKIKQTTVELALERQGLKKLRSERKVAIDSVRTLEKAQKDQVKQAFAGIKHFNIMGVSLRRLRLMTKAVIPGFKLMFKTIKTGIASTGIGLIVLALVSVGTAMASTGKGAKAFKMVLAGLKEAVNFLIKPLQIVGDGIISLFGIDDAPAVDVVAQMKDEIDSLNRALGDIELQQIKNREGNRENKKIVDDTTKSEEVRLAALEEIFNTNKKTNADNLANYNRQLVLQTEVARKAKSAYDWHVQQNASQETLNTLKQAQLTEEKTLLSIKKQIATLTDAQFVAEDNYEKEISEVKSFNINNDTQAQQDLADQQKKWREDRKRGEEELAAIILKLNQESELEALATSEEVEKKKLEFKMEKLKEDIEKSKASKKTKDKALKLLEDDYQQDLQEITDKYQEKTDEKTEKENEKLKAIRDQNILTEEEDETKRALKKLEIQKEAELKRLEDFENFEELKLELEKKYQLKSDDVKKKQEVKNDKMRQAEIDSELAAYGKLAGALSSFAGESKELAAAQAIMSTYAGANKAFEQGGTAGFVTGAAIILQGLANVRKIYQTDVGDGGGGGNLPPADMQTPAPQLMQGAFTLGGGEAPEPLRAFVVTDDMTNSQNQLANIRRRATI